MSLKKKSTSSKLLPSLQPSFMEVEMDEHAGKSTILPTSWGLSTSMCWCTGSRGSARARGVAGAPVSSGDQDDDEMRHGPRCLCFGLLGIGVFNGFQWVSGKWP